MNCPKCKKEAPVGASFCPWCGRKLSPDETPRKRRQRPNGSGTAFKRGSTWTAQVTVAWKLNEDGKALPIRRTKGGYKTKREALAHCSELFSAPKPKRRVTVKEIYEAWLPTHEARVSRSTMDCYRSAWKYFSPIWYMPFSDVDLDALQECVDSCPHGKRTKENMKALSGLLMKYALPRHLTDMNYAQFINTGNGEKGTYPAFTAQQVESIRSLMGNIPYAEYVYVLIYTGFRPTELFSLTPSDFYDGILYGGIKTEAGKNRAVPVSPRILPIVREHSERPSLWLFPKSDGTQMTANYFRDNCFYPVLAAAGIQPIPTPESPAYYVPYSCRHTFANLLKNANGSDKDKAALIGHEDYSTTKRLYQSAELDALRAIMDSL